MGDPKTKWLTEEDQYLILDQIEDTVYRAFFRFMFKQAARPGEASPGLHGLAGVAASLRQGRVDINCYQGRCHSLPSQAINAGVDTKIIQAFLGHKDSRSTARYTHLRTQTLKGMWEVRPQTGPNGLLVNYNLL